MQKFIFYFDRYKAHLDSQKMEKDLKAKASEKMQHFQNSANFTWIEAQFLAKAVETLRNCRQTLMFTYVFAFYQEKNGEMKIFEDNQGDLETSTEKLSEYLENDLDLENKNDQEELQKVRQKVQDLTRYVENRQKSLLAHIKEGIEKEFFFI